MGKSSKDKRDRYQRLARAEGWRNRSAFKLIHLDEQFNLFKDVKRVVDLCAAPGSWSQVLSKEVYEKSPDKEETKIVAVDLQTMVAVDGVIQIQGDITQVTTTTEIIKELEGQKADLVVFDGAPDITGLQDIDEYMQSQLINAAFNIATHVLKSNGNFVAKMFKGKNESFVYSQLRQFFKLVQIAKPKSSRKSNNECFLVCQDYQPPEGYAPTMINPLLNHENCNFDQLGGINRYIKPFNACGDLSAFDAEDSPRPSNSGAQLMTETPI